MLVELTEKEYEIIKKILKEDTDPAQHEFDDAVADTIRMEKDPRRNLKKMNHAYGKSQDAYDNVLDKHDRLNTKINKAKLYNLTNGISQKEDPVDCTGIFLEDEKKAIMMAAHRNYQAGHTFADDIKKAEEFIHDTCENLNNFADEIEQVMMNHKCSLAYRFIGFGSHENQVRWFKDIANRVYEKFIEAEKYRNA